MQKKLSCSLTLLVLFTSTVCVSVAQTPTPDSIAASYSLTKTGFGSADRITVPGDIYVIHADGLQARAIADHVTPTNSFQDGKLIPASKGFRGAFGTAGDTKQIEPGKRFYLHNVELKDGAVIFTFISLDKVTVVGQNGSASSRVRMYLKFPLSKNADLSPADIHQMTDPLFTPEGAVIPAKTVALGQSGDDVRKALGDPEKEIDLGAKKILIYKDLKVTLVDDKVTDAS